MKIFIIKTALPAAVLMLILGFAGCPLPLVPVDTTQPRYMLTLNTSTLADIHMEGSNFTPLSREIRVRNDGNRILEAVNLVITNNLDGFVLSESSLGTIQPGTEKTFTITFPALYAPQKFHKTSNLIIGNEKVQKKINLLYGISKKITIALKLNRNYLQVSGIKTDDLPLPPPMISVDNPADKQDGWFWYSSDTNVLDVDRETGTLEPKKAGDAYIGLIPDDTNLPFEFKGMEITVEPPVEALQLEYDNVQDINGKYIAELDPDDLIQPNASTIAAITAAKGSAPNSRVEFTKTVPGGGQDSVFGPVNADTGELKAAGTQGNESDIRINARLTRDNAAGVAVTTHWGSIDIHGKINKIGNVSQAVVSTVKAVAKIPGISETSNEIIITFDKAVSNISDVKDGFRVIVGGIDTAIQSARLNRDAITLYTVSVFNKYKTVEIRYVSGNITSAGVPVADFVFPVDLTDIAADITPPRIVSALVEDASRTKVQVTFSEPVVIKDATKLGVRIARFYKQELPALNTGTGSILSKNTKGGVSPFTTTVDKISNDGTTGASVWSFTLSFSAQYADIISLMATAAGAVEDEQGNQLSAVGEFVVRSMVKRTKEPIEATGAAGLYINGTSKVSNQGANLWKESLTWLKNNKPGDKDIIVLILDQDQTGYSASGDTETAAIWDNLNANNKWCAFIITTKTGTSKDIKVTIPAGRALMVRNNVTVVIDEYLDFVNTGGATGYSAMFGIQSGSSLILDGGKIRNFKSSADNVNASGGVYLGNQAPGTGMGPYGSYFLMNSGEISGNSLENSKNNVEQLTARAGGVGLNFLSVFVMHGGSISGNKVNQSDTTSAVPAAGGICAGMINNTKSGSETPMPGGAAIYITGGKIENNTVTGGNAGASAGGVFTSGTFQKTGGILSGNTSSMSGNAKAGNLLISSTANGSGGTLKKRDADSGADDAIFVYAQKDATTASVPAYYFYETLSWWASGWGSNLWN